MSLFLFQFSAPFFFPLPCADLSPPTLFFNTPLLVLHFPSALMRRVLPSMHNRGVLKKKHGLRGLVSKLVSRMRAFSFPLCRACVYLLQILAKTPTASCYRHDTTHAPSVFCCCINLFELEALCNKKHVRICLLVSIKLPQHAASPIDLQRERERHN